MVPKIIHYCWFGRQPKPKDVEYNIATWKKYCPDYRLVEWNEDNFNIQFNTYSRQAYENRKWAFVSDVARLYALVNMGGIYMDTDVEVVKSFDDLLDTKGFLGFEGTKWIATSAMGAEPDNPIMKRCLLEYNERLFINEDGTQDKDTNVVILTKLLEKDQDLVLDGKRQSLPFFDIYPSDFFTPYDYISGILNKTENTHTIHWFNRSWLNHSPLRLKLSQFYHRLVGRKLK